jgi:sirohydrochlorin cobaltochelatase
MGEYRRGVVLVGHGGVPKDCPQDLIVQLKGLERRRRAACLSPTQEEVELDRRIRRWPRTQKTDPYRAGLEILAARLRPLLDGMTLKTAYNEFCAPSLEEAIDECIAEGVSDVTVLTTMFTPGGSHSEVEIPEALQTLRARHPSASIRYAWPFDLDLVVSLLAEHLKGFQHA